jgi:hypothetical protein
VKYGRVLIGSVVCLAIGLDVIFTYCQGNAGFNFGSPVSGTNLQISITTKGVPALVGMMFTLLGLLLQLIALIAAITAQFASPSAGQLEASAEMRTSTES